MKVILKVDLSDLQAAMRVVETYQKYYNTPKWDKVKIDFDRKFTVHETQKGTIVVNYK